MTTSDGAVWTAGLAHVILSPAATHFFEAQAMTTDTLDTAMGALWLHAFAAETRVDVSKWTVKPLRDNLCFQELPDHESASKLAAFLKTQHLVSTCICPPLARGYEVVVVRVTPPAKGC